MFNDRDSLELLDSLYVYIIEEVADLKASVE